MEDANTQEIKFWIEDDGPGVVEDVKDRLFDEFNKYQDNSFDSHGSGLSIVRRILTRLEGHVGYEEVLAGGSRFWFSLPIKELV